MTIILLLRHKKIEGQVWRNLPRTCCHKWESLVTVCIGYLPSFPSLGNQSRTGFVKSCVPFAVRSCYWSYWVQGEASAQCRFQGKSRGKLILEQHASVVFFLRLKMERAWNSAWPGGERFHLKAPFFLSSLFSV